MFDGIAARYDLLNAIMSLGLHRRWRRRLARALAPAAEGRALDVATGTADVALALARRYPRARVVGLDPSRAMLARGREKVETAGLGERVSLVEGDAQALPFGDDTFDGACVAFGIRNIPDREAALGELHRVLRPGAPLAVLELSEPTGGLAAPLARLYVHRVVPAVGRLLADRAAYAYLPSSIAAFPAPAAFAATMARAGFGDVSVRRLTMGAAHLFVGRAA